VLEAGARDGSILKLFSDNHFTDELHAVEISESGVTQINAKNIELLKSVQLFDGYKLPFEDKFFDLFILSQFLAYGHINLHTPTSLKSFLIKEKFRIERELTGLYHRDTFFLVKNLSCKN